MSGRFYSFHGWGITNEKLRELLPDELDNFTKTLERYEVSQMGYAESWQYREYIPISSAAEEEMDHAFGKLNKAFNDKTGLCLELIPIGLDIHQDTAFDPEKTFWVTGVITFTKAGKKALKTNLVEELEWVEYA